MSRFSLALRSLFLLEQFLLNSQCVEIALAIGDAKN
jgi:hypothetical protein